MTLDKYIKSLYLSLCLQMFLRSSFTRNHVNWWWKIFIYRYTEKVSVLYKMRRMENRGMVCRLSCPNLLERFWVLKKEEDFWDSNKSSTESQNWWGGLSSHSTMVSYPSLELRRPGQGGEVAVAENCSVSRAAGEPLCLLGEGVLVKDNGRLTT